MGAAYFSQMGDLFTDAAEERMTDVAPLALRMRPRKLDEVVGQGHVLGAALRLAIEQDRLGSGIFYRPPGSRETTPPHLAAPTTGAAFERLAAGSAPGSHGRAGPARA